MVLVLKLGGILMGILCRTIFPYLRKLRAGQVVKFQKKYWLSALASFILGIITTLLIFPEFRIDQAGAGLEASFKLFCVAFAFGFGFNSIVAEGARWAELAKNNKLTPKG